MNAGTIQRINSLRKARLSYLEMTKAEEDRYLAYVSRQHEEKLAVGWPYLVRMFQVDVVFHPEDGKLPKWHGFVSSYDADNASGKGWRMAVTMLPECRSTPYEVVVRDVTRRFNG